MSIVGSKTYWALKGAQLGFTAGATFVLPLAFLVVAPRSGVEGLVVLGIAATFGASGALGGAGLGGFAPPALERVRGRVPLTALVLLNGLLGAVAGAVAWTVPIGLVLATLGAKSGCLMLVDPVTLLFLPIPLLVGAVTATLWWLPFTVATVTGRRWPVTTIAGVLGPLLVYLLGALLLSLAML